MATHIQTTFYIPPFTEIFSPPPSQTSPAITNYITKTNLKFYSDKTNKYVEIEPVLDATFTDYQAIYFKLFNLTKPEIILIDYSRIEKLGIERGDPALLPIKITEPVYTYKLNIYCLPDHPEDFEGKETIFDNEMNKFYLIYSEEIVY